ncbi:divalent metal cation transporter [Desulfotomaculum copahuensis]|uniref:Divalent metal cation transporter MntH n=1 Tax=Desulfotomaculum copahuensis TaxID=1838280 RepID=A0A1B7LEI2_9FIRM|nr:divalent metal cation transporter [Desulfotomaculum copahuensis]
MLREAKIQGASAQTVDVGFGRIVTYDRSRVFNRLRQFLMYLGPAFIVSVAYIDPGNFATNISGGSKFNYSLLWVILWSNLMAIFLQSISAKLGIATGANLPEMCARLFTQKTNWFFWIGAEIAAMATDLAEFLGGALGLYLLFKIPLVYAGALTGVLTFFIIFLERYGQRVVEAVITGMVAVITVAYTIELFLAKPDWAQVGLHTLVPSLPNGEAVLIAVGMLGATVMPHVIYLHSQLVQCRKTIQTDIQKLKHFKLEMMDIILAMNIAFLVNAAMVVVSASVFFTRSMAVESIEQAHQSLTPLLGSLSSGAFAIALLASGLSSSAVGTLAGQTIMKGFVNLNIPLTVRRLVTMVPAMVIISLGIDPIKALVMSQVVLSFALPLAIVPLMLITKRKDIMGALVNKPLTNVIGWVITMIIVSINAVLLYLTFTGNA